MNNKILCSTGALIGKVNGFDHTIAIRYRREIICDGFELMVLPAWYGRFDSIAGDFERADMQFDVLHIEKEIGMILSLGGEESQHGIELFCENCRLAKMVGARKAVLHLWGGAPSDSHFEKNLAAYPKLCEIAEQAGILLTVENIPCTTYDPMRIFHRIIQQNPDVRFTFDTRFGAFHKQLFDMIDDADIFPRVAHMHISDYGGNGMEWGKIRPILHPTEGVIPFEDFFAALKPRYFGSITLESPVMYEGGHDIAKLNQSLSYIREHMC